jgi:O-antigen/teichoic acid export membrane protein
MSLDTANRNSIADAGSPSPLRNGLYNVGGQFVRGAIGVLAIPFLIRLLGISEYGVWSLACAFLALITMCEAGFSVAAAVFLSKDLATNDTREAGRTLAFILTCATLLSAAVGLFLWFVGPLLVRPLTAFGPAERAGAGRALQIAGFGAATLILQRTLVGIEQAFNRYGVINALDLTQALLTNLGLISVAWWGGKTVAMMKWQVLASTLLLVAHVGVVIRLFRNHKLRFGWSGSKGREMFRYSLATWAATLGSAAFGQCDRLIVGGVLGAPALGVYSAITSVTSKINSFSGAAVQPLVPSLSRDLAINVSPEPRIRQAVHLNALIAAGSGIFLYVLADWVMRIMIPGASGPHEILGLQVAAVIYALYSLNAPGHFILFAVGRPQINAIVTVSGAIVSLALIFVGARYFGLLGALGGNAGYLFLFVLTTSGLRKVRISLVRYVTWMAFPLAGLVAAVLVGWFLQDHFWWRAAFVALEGAVFSCWFWRTHVDTNWFRFDFGRVSES